jgi:dTDP-4-dehydrorhamnose 3,5-epimerase
MGIKMTETKISECFLLSKTPFKDIRGDFTKTYDAKLLKNAGLDFSIAEVFYSNSNKNVLRGLHFQAPPADHTKLVTCLNGHIMDVVVDLRMDSPTFQKAIGIELIGLDGQSLLIPKGCAHGLYTFSDNSLVSYLVETGHSPAHDSGVLWSSIDFNWPCKNPIISDRDSKMPSIQDYKTPFKMQKDL